MKLCKYNEFILISKQLYFDDLCKALRQTYILKTNATTHYGSELFPSSKRRTASVHSFQVAAKNEHLISLQLRYLFRRKIRSFDSIVRSHIKYEVTKKTGKATENLRLCDHVLMAVIAKSEGTFHQEHQGSHIQNNGNNNLKHGLHHLLLQS